MKTIKLNFTPFFKCCLVILACLPSIASVVAAPPDFDFRNPVLISGTNLALNSRYRFSNVRTGIDGIVTIMAFTGGATLSQIDGPTGYVEAFQPVITVPANSNGYVEFRIQFVTTGTVASIIMPQIASTSLDIDGTLSGTGNLFEYDMVGLNSATSVYNFDMGTTELSMNSSGGWVTGTNVTGNNYSGVDTSAKNVMFTVINYNSSSFRVRVGADNRSTAATSRNKSIYFLNFAYSSGLLSRNSLVNFEADYNKTNVSLQWQMEDVKEIAKMSVERSSTGNEFVSIHNIDAATLGNRKSYQYSDYAPVYDKVNYRLKMVNINGSISYSKVITILSPSIGSTTLNVYYAGSGTRPNIIIHSPIKTAGKLMLIDLMGNVQYRTDVMLQEGKNSINVPNLHLLNGGYRIAVLQIGNAIYTNKFIAKAF